MFQNKNERERLSTFLIYGLVITPLSLFEQPEFVRMDVLLPPKG